MRAQRTWIEALEGRRLLSVSIGSIAVTPLAAKPAPRIVARGEKVRLSAQDVTTSPFDGVRSVTYFIDADDDGSFGGPDVLIGRAHNPANHFAVTGFLKRSSAADGTVTVSAIAQGLADPADFGPATTQSVTLPPAPATGKSSSDSTGQDSQVKAAARAAAAQTDSAELQGLEFEQQSNDLAAPQLSASDLGVLNAPNG